MIEPNGVPRFAGKLRPLLIDCCHRDSMLSWWRIRSTITVCWRAESRDHDPCLSPSAPRMRLWLRRFRSWGLVAVQKPRAAMSRGQNRVHPLDVFAFDVADLTHLCIHIVWIHGLGPLLSLFPRPSHSVPYPYGRHWCRGTDDTAANGVRESNMEFGRRYIC
jgi:hypothetical protein